MGKIIIVAPKTPSNAPEAVLHQADSSPHSVQSLGSALLNVAVAFPSPPPVSAGSNSLPHLEENTPPSEKLPVVESPTQFLRKRPLEDILIRLAIQLEENLQNRSTKFSGIPELVQFVISQYDANDFAQPKCIYLIYKIREFFRQSAQAGLFDIKTIMRIFRDSKTRPALQILLATADRLCPCTAKIYEHSIPKEARFRLWIDRKHQSKGEDVFENEVGYKAAMTRAFLHVENTLGQRMDVDHFEALHDLCIDNVRRENGDLFMKGYGVIRPFDDKEVCYGIDLTFITPEARIEWETHGLIASTREQAIQKKGFLACLEDSQIIAFGSDHLSTLEEVKAKVNSLFDHYYQSIAAINPRDWFAREKKLEAIVNLCRALEIYHAFTDGNQRTIAFALLNKLVRENQLGHGVILHTPYMFDGYYSTHQMINAVEKGIKNFYEEGLGQ